MVILSFVLAGFGHDVLVVRGGKPLVEGFDATLCTGEGGVLDFKGILFCGTAALGGTMQGSEVWSAPPNPRAILIEALGHLLDQLRYEISGLEFELAWVALVGELEGL